MKNNLAPEFISSSSKQLSTTQGVLFSEIKSVIPGPVPEPFLLHNLNDELISEFWQLYKVVFLSKPNENESASPITKTDLKIFQWAISILSPGSLEMLSKSNKENKAEIVSIALLFNYMFRIKTIIGDDFPFYFPDISNIEPFLESLAKPMISVLSGQAVSLPENSTLKKKGDFDWAKGSEVIHRVFTAFDKSVDKVGQKYFSKPTLKKYSDFLDNWNGESLSGGQKWLQNELTGIASDEKPLLRLVLLSTADTEHITKKDISNVKELGFNNRDILSLIIWSSFKATKTIGAWA